MDKDLHDIEDLFRAGLDDNEERPSSNVWAAVDNRLDKDTVIIIKKKYNTLKKISLLLLLLLIGLSLYELSNRHTDDSLAKINSTSVDKEPTPNNDIQKQNNKNAFTSKEQVNPKDLTNNTAVNTIPGNSTIITQSPGNNFIINKQNQTAVSPGVKSITNPSFVLKQNSIRNMIPGYREKINPVNTGSDIQEAATGNNAVQLTNAIPVPGQWNPRPVEKTSRQIPASELKNSILLMISTNKNPLLDTKDLLATQKKNSQAKSFRFSLTGFFSPDIASYHLVEDQPGNQRETASKIEKGERHEFSSTSGLLLDYRLSKHWSLQSGLSFSNTNIKVDPKTIYAQNDNNGDIKYRVNISSGYGYILPSFQNTPLIGDSLKVTAATHKLRYINIPVAVKYSAGKNKLCFEAMAGVTADFLTKGKLETEVQKGSNNEVDILNNILGLKSVYFSGLAGAGVAYKLTKRVSVTLMPTARFALTPINKGAVVKTYPNSFGLSAGARISF